jgi:flagellar biogenesis protein FliO
MVAVERLSLTPQHSLHMVRVNGREFVVATHPQGCTLVTAVAEQAIGTGA